MSELPGRLGTLTARDIMTKNVIVVAESDTIETAVETLKKNRITGAPVVGERNKFVGILSINDLVAAGAASSPQQQKPPTAALSHGDDQTTWDLFERAGSFDRALTVERVEQRMSRQVTSVAAAAPLIEVARAMCSGHWHRVPVVDDEGALIGIISTMDVLAALVNVADEPN